MHRPLRIASVASHPLVWVGALVAVVLAIYWPGLTGGFVFDDFPNIVNNPALRVEFGSTPSAWVAALFSSPASTLQRPLAMLTFAINHALTGLDPYWMKATNVGIHMVNTVLVFGLCRRLVVAAGEADAARAARVALWIAAVWALNPINVTAVLFVVQRMESLCHTFVFAGLWMYLEGRARLLAGRGGWGLLLTGLVGATAVGLSAKESAVLLPLYALVIEWALLGWSSPRGTRDRRLVATFGLTLLLPLLLGLAWLLPGVVSGSAFAGREFGVAQRLLTETRVVVDYLRWTLLPQPADMGLYHDDYPLSRALLSPPSTLLALLTLVAMLATMLAMRKRRPLIALGLAWFLCAQLLTATVIPLELMFEHRNYFASLGLCVAVGDACLRAPRQRTVRWLGVACALLLPLAYAGATAMRALDWRDPLRFALMETARHPLSARAQYDVARLYVILSGYRADSPYVARAFASLEAAMRAPGSSTLPEATALTLAARTGHAADPRWWLRLQDKLRSRPIGPQETTALAWLVQCQIDRQCLFSRQDMVATFAAAQRQPPMAEVLNIQGNYVLNILGDHAWALRLWQDAASSAPGVAEYQASVARLLILDGRGHDALPYIARVRALGRFGQYAPLADRLQAEARNGN